MLMSMICAPASTLRRAASAIICGSPPAICTTRGSGSPLWSMRRRDFSVCHRRTSQVSISPAAIPAPMRRHSRRNGRSVTPAIGASARLFGTLMGTDADRIGREDISAHRGTSAAHTGPAAPAQTHIEAEAFRIGAGVDDDDGRVGLLRGSQQPVGRSRGIEILRGFELARAHAARPSGLRAPASAADRAARTLARFFMLARTFERARAASDPSRRAIAGSRTRAGSSRAQVRAKQAVEADERWSEQRMACERVAILCTNWIASSNTSGPAQDRPDRRRGGAVAGAAEDRTLSLAACARPLRLRAHSLLGDFVAATRRRSISPASSRRLVVRCDELVIDLDDASSSAMHPCRRSRPIPRWFPRASAARRARSSGTR